MLPIDAPLHERKGVTNNACVRARHMGWRHWCSSDGKDSVRGTKGFTRCCCFSGQLRGEVACGNKHRN